ncbi:hypothetical protein Nepgr_006844 [Nepenthes gracilis]|uniref:Uncharacterized protein n=1 Tax=Nepenthes gracilis TaxID=150966 RepID=A0AAD3S642_NEPGR|nr:hypothetical protein Nepgr_006844 [Nepenthes gracilis]
MDLNENLWQLDCIVGPKSLECLQENIKEMNQCFKQMLKCVGVGDDLATKVLIDEYGDISIKNPETYEQNSSALIIDIKEFHQVCRSLKKHYISLADQMRNMSSGMFDPGIDQDSSFLTPELKQGLQKCAPHADSLNTFLSSGGGSSDFSLKEGSQPLSSSSLSDSESESYNLSPNNYVVRHVNDDSRQLSQKFTGSDALLVGMKGKLMVAKGLNEDGTPKEMKYDSCNELLERVANNEKELSIAKGKLQCSQEEIARLKYELSKRVSGREPQENTLYELEPSCFDNSGLERIKVSQLRNQLTELETQVLDSNLKNAALVEEIDRARKNIQTSEDAVAKLKQEHRNETLELTYKFQGQLDLANQNVGMLESELALERRLVSELQEMIVRYTNDLTNQGMEVQELNFALSNAQKNFAVERSELLSDISLLSQQQCLLQGTLEESELKTKLLEGQIKQCQSEKMEIKLLHEDQGKYLLGEIEVLKAELAEKCDAISALNRSLDADKHNYDMLMSVKDENIAKLQTLTAELRCKDIQIEQMEQRFNQLTREHAEQLTGSEITQELVKDLRLRMVELEKEVNWQRVVISEMADGKREAIKQLCFSLEYYRTGYHELRMAFVGQKHLSAVVS